MRLTKTSVFGTIVLWLLSGIAFDGMAEESAASFRISPPPIGYPDIVPGNRQITAGANGVYTRTEVLEQGLTIMGVTVFAGMDESFNERFMLSGSAGAGILFGNQYDLSMLMLPLELSAVFTIVDRDTVALYGFGGGGGSLSLTALTVTIPQPVPYTATFIDDDTTVTINTTMGAIHGGAQVNLAAAPWIASLFGVYHYSGGSYTTSQRSTMSYDYPSSSGSIENTGSISLGIDLLYTPSGIALSSIVQQREAVTTVTVAFRKLLDSRSR